MAANLYTYALIRSLFEQGQDYIDSFWPLVVRILPIEGYESLESLQANLREQFGLEVPQHSLTTILTRATRQGHIQRKHNKCALTQAGIKYKATLEGEREVDRRINALVESARQFLGSECKLTLSAEETRKVLEGFVANQIQLLETYLRSEPASGPSENSNSELKEAEQGILKYLDRIESNDPTQFATLRELAIGGIISATIHSTSIAEIGRRFEPTIVYLDTNVLLRLLDLDYPESNEPAKELFNLMKKEGVFTFKVLDCTFEELVAYVRRFETSRRYFVRGVKIDSIYGYLHSVGWTSATVREFLASLDEKLKELGISIEFAPIVVNSVKHDDPRRDRLHLFKPKQSPRGQNHDLAAIDWVIKRRGGAKHLLERARVLFLSQDIRLAMFNAEVMHHKERQTICEVILDRILTTILWLKNPTHIKDIPLRTIIAAHSRGLMINEDVWIRFCENVEQLRSRKRLDNLDVSILVYDQDVQKSLSLQPEGKRDGINEEWILKSLSTAKSKIDSQTAEELKKQQVLFEEGRKQSDSQRQSQLQAAMDSYKSALKAESLLLTDRVFRYGGIAVALGVTIPAFLFIPKLLKLWEIVEPVAWVITIVFGVVVWALGLSVDAFAWRRKWKQQLYETIYIRKTKKLKPLEETVVGPSEQNP